MESIVVSPFTETDVNYRDSSFDIDNIGRYALHFHLYKNACDVSINDTREQRCVFFERMQSTEATENFSVLAEKLKKLIEEHRFFSVRNWKEVGLTLSHRSFCLIPEKYFDERTAPSILRLNAEVNTDKNYLQYTQHTDASLVCLFEFPKVLDELLMEHYPHSTPKIAHFTGAFVTGLLKLGDSIRRKDTLHLLFENDFVVIAVMDGNKLKYLNVFDVRDKNDVVYFTMVVAQELEIPAGELKFFLYGEISEQAEVTSLLKRYGRLHMSERIPVISEDSKFDVESQRFFTLFSSYFI